MKVSTVFKLFPSRSMAFIFVLAVIVFIAGIYAVNFFFLDTYSIDDSVLKGQKLEEKFISNLSKGSVVLEKNNIEKNKNTVGKKNDFKEIFVYIAGEVKNPGVIKIREGARLYECLDKAGGVTENTDLLEHNLAIKVKDGEKYIFRNKNDLNISYPDGENFNSNDDAKTKVSLSTATKEELKTLSGIGDKIADHIVKYRRANGAFQNIEELQNVKGIGESLFNKIKNDIVP